MHPGPTAEDVHAARRRVRGYAQHTPMVESGLLSRVSRSAVKLKLECSQDTRSFKIRGATNAIICRHEAGSLKGVVTYSTGNHGRATAAVARRLGIPAVICLSRNTTEEKRAALAASGADLRLVGDSQDEAAVVAASLAARTGLDLIDPINDLNVTAGHGTIGLELLGDWPEVDTVVVPVSGGALISGIALAVKSQSPRTRVVGVSMSGGAAMYQSQQAGRPVEVPEVETLADSLQGGISLDNSHTFQMIRELVDDLILVEEDEIGLAMALAFREEGLVLEGAGACPIAALLVSKPGSFGGNVALVASGGMVDPEIICRLGTRHAARLDALRERPLPGSSHLATDMTRK